MKSYNEKEIKEICSGRDNCNGCEFYNGEFCEVVGEDAEAPSEWGIDEYIEFDLFDDED